MTLKELIAQIEQLDENLLICVDRTAGWTPQSEAILAKREQVESLNTKPAYPYFLEVFVAKDVLEAWSFARGGQIPDLDQSCAALIYYADNDAYIPPDK